MTLNLCYEPTGSNGHISGETVNPSGTTMSTEVHRPSDTVTPTMSDEVNILQTLTPEVSMSSGESILPAPSETVKSSTVEEPSLHTTSGSPIPQVGMSFGKLALLAPKPNAISISTGEPTPSGSPVATSSVELVLPAPSTGSMKPSTAMSPEETVAPMPTAGSTAPVVTSQMSSELEATTVTNTGK